MTAATPKNQLSTRAIAYLEKRGIGADTALDQGLASASAGNGIEFPYVENDDRKNIKIWKPPPNEFRWHFQEKGIPRGLWNFDACLDPHAIRKVDPIPIIITEGEWDALTAIQCGFPLAVSVPNGAPEPRKEGQEDPGNRYSWFARLESQFLEVKRWIIATDNDPPGHQLAADLVRLFGPARCSFVNYPAGCKDLNDVLVKNGQIAVVSVINNAKPYPIAGLYRFSDLPPEPAREYLSTGWANLDAGWRPWPGSFTVVTGIPGSGKTTWLAALAGHYAENYHLSTTFGALENQPGDYVAELLRYRLRRDPREASHDDLMRAQDWVDKYFSFIVEDDTDLTLDVYLERAEAAVIKYGTAMNIIDPFNSIEPSRFKDETETEFISWAIRQQMRFARRWKQVYICATHPTKAAGDLKKQEHLNLYLIAGSAHWANKCEVGLVLHRAANTNTLNVRVAKNRYRDSGKQGVTAQLMLEQSSNRYSDADIVETMGLGV